MNPDPDFYADGGQRKPERRPEPVATSEQVKAAVALARANLEAAVKRRTEGDKR